MKSIKVKTFCAGALGLVMLASCSDWLDPKPLSFLHQKIHLILMRV